MSAVTTADAQKDLLQQAMLDPAAFAWLASRGQWHLAPHLDLLAEKLLDVAQGKLKRLLIQMPPRHGKSELASGYFPPWYLGTFPDRHVILASYEHDFAASWGAKARDRFAAWGPVLWRRWVKRDKQAADDWQVAGQRGGMVCAGVGGPITGRGADLLIIDDPVKSAEEADSETYRNRAWDWYRATAYTRLEPEGALLLIMTRWHEDDLAGRILANQGEETVPWEVISLPALAEGDDPLGREAGQALWPERYDERALVEIRAQLGSYHFAALYQQRPAPPEGALFKEEWWRFWAEAPACDEMLLSVDCSYKDGKDSSFTVIQVWGRVGVRLYLLDQWRRQCGFNDARAAVKQMAERWPAARVKLIEDKANGRAVIESLQSEIGGILAVDPKGGKYSRAQAVLPLLELGRVYVPQPGRLPWVNELLIEAQHFPVGAHDDQVDAMTQALQRWIWVKEKREEPDPGPSTSGRTIAAIRAHAQLLGMGTPEEPGSLYG